MKKIFMRILLVTLLFTSVFALFACNKNSDDTQQVKKNQLQPLTVYDGSIRSGEKKLAGSGKYTLDSFTLNRGIENLKQAGYTQLAFEISIELREVDNCLQYVYIYSSSDIMLRKEILSHGGSSKDKSWGVHNLTFRINIADLDSNVLKFKCQAEYKIFHDFYVGSVRANIKAV